MQTNKYIATDSSKGRGYIDCEIVEEWGYEVNQNFNDNDWMLRSYVCRSSEADEKTKSESTQTTGSTR